MDLIWLTYHNTEWASSKGQKCCPSGTSKWWALTERITQTTTEATSWLFTTPDRQERMWPRDRVPPAACSLPQEGQLSAAALSLDSGHSKCWTLGNAPVSWRGDHRFPFSWARMGGKVHSGPETAPATVFYVSLKAIHTYMAHTQHWHYALTVTWRARGSSQWFI